jgi:putative ABC transport system substrate-binding protein
MKRRHFITFIGGAVAMPVVARAQQNERIRRIGVLSGSAADDQDNNVRLAAFQQRLQQLGWTDRHNVRIDCRFAEGNADSYHKYAAELITLAPDVILAPAVLWRQCSRPPARYRSCLRSPTADEVIE